MGQTTSKKKIHLSLGEIQQLTAGNTSLQTIFNHHKNSSGVLQIKDLEAIFEKRLNFRIVKKLYKICALEKNKFTFEDLKYLYSLFHTKNYEAKLNFITELIFVNKTQLTSENYRRKLSFIFGECLTLVEKLAAQEFIAHMSNNNKITKENFIKNLDYQHKSVVHEFSFFSEYDKVGNKGMIADKEDNKLILISNQTVCECLKSKPNENKTETLRTNIDKYDRMELEFRRIERENNGVFSISFFEDILRKVQIHPKLISLIVSYLKKKTQKSFLDFQNFKFLISRFSEGSESMVNYIYEIIAFPKEYIQKNDLLMLVKSISPETNSKEINSVLENLKISKNKVNFQSFYEIYNLISDDISESLEKIQYIPYLFFKLKCEDKIIEKNCIEILMKNNKDLKTYIQEVVSAENEFYLIDVDFWGNWCEYTSWTDKKEVPESSTKLVRDEKNQTIKPSKPRINTSKIADSNGKLYQGLVYFRDFVIVTAQMYELFKSWYINLGPVVKRNKIEYYAEVTESKTKNTSKNPNSSVLKYEIEVYPIFIKTYTFEDILSRSKHKTMEGLREQLGNIAFILSEQSNSNIKEVYPCSRLTKFRDVLKNLEMSKNLEYGKCRLWVFYQNKFYIPGLDRTLQEENINDLAIIVCEMNKDKKWPSENLESEEYKKSKVALSSKVYVGLMNIGNTCYMNSILQLFINNKDLKNILLSDYFENSINYRNRFGARGVAMKEFINILKEKWVEDKKTIVPRKWKEIIGNINNTFRGFDQQDAHDYFNFMLDLLHEEINLKTVKEYIENPDKYDGSEEDLANLYWANNLRRNASFIYSLYLGQLKSTLSCQRCNYNKISFETFSSVPLPIPQGSKIALEIVLFRIPFTFKVYYDNFHHFFENANSNFQKLDRRVQLKLLRRQSLDYPIDFNNLEKLDESILSLKSNHETNTNIFIGKPSTEFNFNLKSQIPNEALNTIFYEANKEIYMKRGENMYMSTLSTNIPIKLKIEIDRKEKVEKIISIIKKLYDLELEQEGRYTQFLILNQGNFVDKNLTVDDCFQHNQVLFIYELLNTNGLNKLFNYNSEETIIPLCQERIHAFSRNLDIRFNNSLASEFLVQISHRYSFIKDVYLFNNIGYNKLETFFNLIILHNNKSIKASHLYKYIWEKYEYFLNNPTKVEKSLWWKPQSYKQNYTTEIKESEINREVSQNIKFCTPFVLKLVHRSTQACATCPWFKFCSGCIIDPTKKEFIDLLPSHMLVVEWCPEVVKKEMNDMNFKLIINHSSVKQVEEAQMNKTSEKRINIEDCLNLFTEKEDLGDDQLYCTNCKQQTSWFKTYEYERLPPYLVIVLKRFKFTRMYRRKIDMFVDFPLNDLDVSKYMSGKKDSAPAYHLYGIVNHTGSMNGGHYTSTIRQENKWIKYDDSHAYEVDENSIKTSSAYILVYKLKDDNLITSNEYLNMLINAVFYEHDLRSYNIEPISSDSKSKKLFVKPNSKMLDLNVVSSRPSSGNINYGSSFNSLRRVESSGKRFFKGEPVRTPYGRGHVLYTYEIESTPFVKVKLKDGFASVRADNDSIVKETQFAYNKPTKEEEEKEREEMKKQEEEKKKKEDPKKQQSRYSAMICRCNIF